MASVTFKVEGLRELGARFAKLDAKVQNKAAGKATSKGAGIVKKAGKNNLRRSPSVDSGLVEKNVILKKISKRQTRLTSEHIVTVKRVKYQQDNKGGSRNTKRVAGFLEHGTVNMPAEPWLRPAFDGNVQNAITAIRDTLAAEIFKGGA